MKDELILYQELLGLIAPEQIRSNFKLTTIQEKKGSITLVFEEKESLVPDDLQGKEVVNDGFMNPVELQTFPLNDKKLYLSIRRRRWKEKGTPGPSYSNKYELHRKGMKTTNEFGDFLKEELGLSPDKFNRFWEDTTH
jgi:hypothetical protein